MNLQQVAYKGIETVLRVLGLIPRYRAFQLGNILGNILFLIDGKHRKITLENLTHAFGHEKNQDEITLLARRVFENIGQIIFEIGWSLTLKDEDVKRYFNIEGLSHIKKAYEKNKGVLTLTAHFGNWELLALIAAQTGLPTNIVFRPLDFLPLDQVFLKLRSRFGAHLIPSAHSMRKILSCLKKGEAVALLMDQNVDWYEGVFVDFFGRRACTNKGMALLALKTEAPVVPVFLVRNKSGFKAEIGPELSLIKTGDKTKDIEANTQQYNEAIEAFVRRYPEQWFWVHQRWKTKPFSPWPNLQGH
jgi:KDO2-lipid IV(A) lauroyltransferase